MARIAEMTIINGHRTVQARVHTYDFCILCPSYDQQHSTDMKFEPRTDVGERDRVDGGNTSDCQSNSSIYLPA